MTQHIVDEIYAQYIIVIFSSGFGEVFVRA